MRVFRIFVLIAASLFAISGRAADADAAAVKATMKSFYQAMEAGDAGAVRSLFHTSTDAEKALADADAAQLTAARALGEAARNKFAATGDALSRGLPTHEEIAKLDSAEIAIDGESATIKLLGQSKALRLVKSDGRWKISIADYAGATPANIADQTAVLKDLASVYTQVAADINADKFPSAQDAQRTLQQKLQAVVASTLQKHPPATSKAEKP